MPVTLLLIAYLYCAGLSLLAFAGMLYRHDRRDPEQRRVAGVTFSTGAAVLAVAVLV